MPIFEYRGLTKQGKNIKGVTDADSLRSARLKLKKEGVFVTDIRNKQKAADNAAKKKGKASREKVGIKDLSLMTRQLAVLIKSNIPLVDALTAVSEQVEHPVLAEAIADCKNMVNEGGSLHKALAKYPNIFSNIYVSMVEAGEMSGTLDMILLRLAEFTESQHELNVKVRGALTYPVIMLVVTFSLLIFLFSYVIPKITVIFESNPELELPWYTKIIIDFSALTAEYWYILVGGIVISALVFKSWLNSPSGRKQWDRVSLNLPKAGKLIRMVAVARFTRTLSTLLNGGVPMLQALLIVRNVVDNDLIAGAIDGARSNISEGESIAAPLKKSGQFPPLVIHMVSIGEKTGELENMLNQVSVAYEFEVKAEIEKLTGLLGPVVLVIMGLVIGVIAVAVMVPMFQMTNIAG